MNSSSGTNHQSISLPKGGGAVKGIGETFQPNLFSGTGDFSIPIAISPGRSGFSPQIALQYSTGNGNGPFGLGWNLSIPRITRKTEKGLPRYTDKDVFVLSGAEDLVVCSQQPPIEYAPGYSVTRYRPRTDSLFARIEKWVRESDDETHWRTTSKENILSIYGKSESARIAAPEDPEDRKRIFQWLLEESFDAKGNHILYEYIQEFPDRAIDTIYEQNRTYTQAYIRRILYGNTPEPDILPESRRTGPIRTATHHQFHTDPDRQLDRHYTFEVLFDYGDQPETLTIPYSHPSPETEIPAGWPVRSDPFSTFRPGYEIRTLHLCKRILMLHHFNEGELVGTPLVKSTDFSITSDPNTQLSLLTAVTVRGYRKSRDGLDYISAAMPPVEFTYSNFEPQKQRYQSVSAEGHDLPPRSLADPGFTLVDLFGDALPDIVRTSETGYDTWQNLGRGHLDRCHPQHGPAPSVSPSQPNTAFGDMGGDGLVDLIVDAPPLSGFFEAKPDGQWQPFKRLEEFPSINFSDPNLRLVDLTGDGLSDILITRDNHFLWYRCLGEEGYADPEAIARIHDLQEFPDLYFDDPAARVRLADMSGDGLSDIVLVHDGRIDYWPNLGYGRFGKRITMANAPHIGYAFDPRRLFLVDLDSSGCADLVYVDFNSVSFWFNQSGNSWSDSNTIHGTPFVTDPTAIQFADFYGTGTASLIWSSDYAFQPGSNYKVIDFCGGRKPYMLSEMQNNLGATTRIQYAPSTRFYLEDKKMGRPWVTNLPFPVQVVEKVEVIDQINKTKLVTSYKYHHGYYDGKEREFRGFGRVDQFDSETFEEFSGPGLHGEGFEFKNSIREHHIAPIETRTWFHTGIYFDPDRYIDHRELTKKYQDEYYKGDTSAFTLEDHYFEQEEVSSGAGPLLPHEAYRALRGAVLRTEVYGRDETVQADHPYLVTNNRYWIKELQSGSDTEYGVYFSTRKESLSYHYERNPDDPRISHQMVLAVDAFGNVTRSAAVAYPRRTPEYEEQDQTLITYTESNFINREEESDWYHIGVTCGSLVYELTGLSREDHTKPFSLTQIKTSAVNAELVSYEDTPRPGVLSKRLINAGWVQYWRDDQTSPCPVGEIDRLALPYKTYQVSLTPGLMTHVYGGRIDAALLEGEGRYIQGDSISVSPSLEIDAEIQAMFNESWWAPSGYQFFDADCFHLPTERIDPFENHFYTDFDNYGLLVHQARDPLGNTVQAENDYRVLQPYQVTDPNQNRTRAAFDVLGMVVGTAVMGKEGDDEGDSLDGFEPDLEAEIVTRHIENPLTDPHPLLGRATTRMVYDLGRYQRGEGPAVVYTLVRERHESQLAPAEKTRIQHRFLYSDGFGREAMSKVQAEPGEVPARDEDGGLRHDESGELLWTDTSPDPRWVGTGRTIYNNKGKAVKKYEPFFSNSHRYEEDAELVHRGVTPILDYDPLGRLIRTDNPNGTFSKVEFDPWHQTTFDENDTVLESGWYSDRGAPAPDGPEPAGSDEQERRAAYLAAQHANTPGIAILDTLGRTFLTLADNRDDHLYRTHVMLDLEGTPLLITDDRDNPVMDYRVDYPLPGGETGYMPAYDVAGQQLYQKSMDSGERLVLMNIAGNPIRNWNSRGHCFRTTYDELQRPTCSYVQYGDGTEILTGRLVYGDGGELSSPETSNLRGRVYQQFDSGGVITNVHFDFKGNLLQSHRRLSRAYRPVTGYDHSLDWSPIDSLTTVSEIAAAAAPLLESGDPYTTRIRYDALNRPISTITPDNSETKPTYNEANLLEQIDIRLRDASTWTPMVRNIDYNAKGQRTLIEYGNSTSTTYTYDDTTYRLVNLSTRRNANGILQNLRYTYDPVGNITAIRDAAQPTIHYNGEEVQPRNSYVYDALYRLIQAKGREHIGQTSGCSPGHRPDLKPHYDFNDCTRMNIPHSHDRPAMRNYTQEFSYDGAGNIRRMHHSARSGDWHRNYDYTEDSNRLLSTSLPGDLEGSPLPQRYVYDDHGNMIQMPHLPLMKWDLWDHLQAGSKQVVSNGTTPETTYYVYDGAGNRVRKVTERQAASGVTPTRMRERIYLGGVEIYREYGRDGETRNLERQTLHVMDDKQRIALVETKTIDEGSEVVSPVSRYRFQLNNHLGSSSLELDEGARVISYEEYYPYGSTSYQAVSGGVEVSAKRYRYTGMERDEETGLNYHSARYYAVWLGRWCSCDPVGLVDGVNLYQYTKNNPINFTDIKGSKRKGNLGGYTLSPPPEESAIAPDLAYSSLLIQYSLPQVSVPITPVAGGGESRGTESRPRRTHVEQLREQLHPVGYFIFNIATAGGLGTAASAADVFSSDYFTDLPTWGQFIFIFGTGSLVTVDRVRSIAFRAGRLQQALTAFEGAEVVEDILPESGSHFSPSSAEGESTPSIPDVECIPTSEIERQSMIEAEFPTGPAAPVSGMRADILHRMRTHIRNIQAEAIDNPEILTQHATEGTTEALTHTNYGRFLEDELAARIRQDPELQELVTRRGGPHHEDFIIDLGEGTPSGVDLTTRGEIGRHYERPELNFLLIYGMPE